MEIQQKDQTDNEKTLKEILDEVKKSIEQSLGVKDGLQDSDNIFCKIMKVYQGTIDIVLYWMLNNKK